MLASERGVVEVEVYRADVAAGERSDVSPTPLIRALRYQADC